MEHKPYWPKDTEFCDPAWNFTKSRMQNWEEYVRGKSRNGHGKVMEQYFSSLWEPRRSTVFVLIMFSE